MKNKLVKRVITAALAAGMVFSLTACGGGVRCGIEHRRITGSGCVGIGISAC